MHNYLIKVYITTVFCVIYTPTSKDCCGIYFYEITALVDYNNKKITKDAKCMY